MKSEYPRRHALARLIHAGDADFKEPMPFGSLPGIEYVADGACAGYRLIAP